MKDHGSVVSVLSVMIIFFAGIMFYITGNVVTLYTIAIIPLLFMFWVMSTKHGFMSFFSILILAMAGYLFYVTKNYNTLFILFGLILPMGMWVDDTFKVKCPKCETEFLAKRPAIQENPSPAPQTRT